MDAPHHPGRCSTSTASPSPSTASRRSNNLSLVDRPRRDAGDHRPERRRQDHDDGRHHRQDPARRGRRRVPRAHTTSPRSTRPRSRRSASAASSRSRRCSRATPSRTTCCSRSKGERGVFATLVHAPVRREHDAHRRDPRRSCGSSDRRDELAGEPQSHGEKQWLEIGMLLAQDPELLLRGRTRRRHDRRRERPAPGNSSSASSDKHRASWSSSTTSSSSDTRREGQCCSAAAVLAEGSGGSGQAPRQGGRSKPISGCRYDQHVASGREASTCITATPSDAGGVTTCRDGQDHRHPRRRRRQDDALRAVAGRTPFPRQLICGQRRGQHAMAPCCRRPARHRLCSAGRQVFPLDRQREPAVGSWPRSGSRPLHPRRYLRACSRSCNRWGAGAAATSWVASSSSSPSVAHSSPARASWFSTSRPRASSPRSSSRTSAAPSAICAQSGEMAIVLVEQYFDFAKRARRPVSSSWTAARSCSPATRRRSMSRPCGGI